MKKFILFFCIFLFGISEYYGQDSISVQILTNWKKGDQFSFNIKKIKTQEKENEGVKKDSAVFSEIVTVLEVNDLYFKNSYKTNNTAMSSYGLANDILKDFNHNKSLEIIYKTDETGAYEGIENWDEVEKQLTLSYDLLLENFKKSKSFKEENLESMKQVLSMMKSKNFVENNVYSELKLIHFLMGIELAENEELKYEEVLPNAFSKEPLRSEAVMKVLQINSKNSEISVSLKKRLNESDVNKFLMSFFKRLNLKNDDFQKALKNSKYNISDETNYLINYEIGIPERIIYKRISQILIAEQKGNRMDEIIIERIK